ncbi:MAG: hypothetical protein AAF447_05150 [Myxococcota bacterium]
MSMRIGHLAGLRVSWVLAVVLSLVGCKADPDDPAGQAEELADPVRRPGAIANLQRLYGTVLADNGSDRTAAPVKAFADQVADKLNRAYIDNPADSQARLSMLTLMNEMREPRTIPALLVALDWRPEVSEEHAMLAAKTFQYMDLDDGQKGEVIEALGAALGKIRQARPVDNRLRVELIRALGGLEDPRAAPHLVRVAMAQTEEQSFQFNRLAAAALGKLGDAELIEPMIKGLFLFSPSNPAMRMNDVAGEGLVRIGRPAVAPLLALLRGENEAAKEIAAAYIEAVKARDEQAAAQMSVAQITGGEATYVLGNLGLPEAFEPLLAEAQAGDPDRRVNGSIALVRLNLGGAESQQVKAVLLAAYENAGDGFRGVQRRAQLLAAMRQAYDASYLDFFFAQATSGDTHPEVRIQAMLAYALLATKDESARAKSWLAANEGDAYHTNFQSTAAKSFEVAESCDEDVACYLRMMDDSDAETVRKAAFMLGRLAVGNAEAIAKLTEKLGAASIEVRLSAVQALDRIAVAGAPAAVEKIEELRRVEEGRAIWTQFSREALPIEARLKVRAS